MKIGIDGRLIDETGVGRYIQNLILELAKRNTKHVFIVYLRNPQYEDFVLPNANWRKRLVYSRWHTLSEQVEMPLAYLKDKLDVVHVPYFTAPIFYPGKFILTIHDLIVLHVTTGKASTLPLPLYALKKLAYKAVLYLGILRAQKIITVSHTVEAELTQAFPFARDRLAVTLEGFDTRLVPTQERLIPETYFLYVGNAYPHKNVEALIRAFEMYVKTHPQSKTSLLLVGRDDMFYARLKGLVATLTSKDRVRFFGPAGDTQLSSLYTHAACLVSPSTAEGFGLPPVEAVSLGTPVLLNDIPIFREVMGDLATYVNVHDQDAFARQLDAIEQNPVDQKLLAKHAFKRFSQKYRWDKLAKQTLAVYESV